MTTHIRLILVFLVLPLILLASGKGNAQVAVSGLLDIVFRNSGDEDITNLTFRKFSNFHSSRARLFFDAAPAENVEVFVQLLMDNSAFQLYGAYLRFSQVAGSELNAHIGLIPNPIGSWGPRTYSNRNPLIGIPLLYNFHSSYSPKGMAPLRSVDDLISERDTRKTGGLPVIYDACWNTGVEFFGTNGKWSYSLGLLSGSLSKPTIEQEKNSPQVTTHITYDISPRVTFGGSAFIGSYLYDGLFSDTIPPGAEFNDYLSGGAGFELHITGRYLEIYSESFYTYWEHPYLPKLKLYSGYVDGKYKFTPGWYVAGRVGFYEPGKMIDSQGVTQHWDYPVKRYESGVGYHPNRNTTIKFVAQINRFDFTNEFDSELYAIQFAVTFD